MARTIAVIHQSLIDATQADLTLGGELTSESKVAIWRLKLYVVAVCHWTIENLQDIYCHTEAAYTEMVCTESFGIPVRI
jgi:hypothetical protein